MWFVCSEAYDLIYTKYIHSIFIGQIKSEIQICQIKPKIGTFLMVEQSFFSLQAKQSVVISNKLIYTSCFTSCR